MHVLARLSKMSLKIMESHRLSALIGIHPIPPSVGSSATAAGDELAPFVRFGERDQRTFYRFEKFGEQPKLDDGKRLIFYQR